MAELNKHEIRSPELQEVMSEIPGSFLKWGLFLFFAIIVSILGVTWFINYPNLVTAQVTITTFNSPASLIARSGGKIERLIVSNEENVIINQPVAIIENTAQFDDVKSLEEFIEILEKNSGWQEKVRNYEVPGALALGEIQADFSSFTTIFRQYKDYLNQKYIPAKLKLLEGQIEKQEEYTTELLNQIRLSEKDLQLVGNSFNRDSLLYVSNIHSISLSEYERSKQALIQKQSSHSSLKGTIKNNEASTLRMKETMLDLQVQLENDLRRFDLDLDEAFQSMKVAIVQWKERYLIESPVRGKITFTTFWNENQVINAGEILATVIPEYTSRIIVRAKIPASGLGRIKVGQDVNIKLSGFPYMEFGVIKGRIKSLSLVPAGEFYIAEFDLVNGLRSSYGIDLGFINEMTGTADIITENSRLIFRLIKPLRSIIK